MTPTEKKKAIQICKAVEKDWAFTDPSDDMDCYVLVNSNRTENKRLKPEKDFVSWMETEGLLEFSKARSDRRGKKREVMDFGDEKVVVPLVYFFKLTSKGLKLLKLKK